MTDIPASAEALTERSRRSLAAAKEVLDRIEQARGPLTQQNVLRPLNDLMVELANVATEAGLLAEVHPELKLREAAEGAAREVEKFRTDLNLNRPLYQALTALDLESLDPLARETVELVRRDMRRAGVELDDGQRQRVRQLQDEMVLLGQEFARNIRDDVRTIELSGPEETEGLPPDYIQSHPAGTDGKIRITTNYPDHIPFMAYARSGRARKALQFEFLNRAVPRNLEGLRDILARRQELATLLGYPHWADFFLEDKMSGSSANVKRFLDQLRQVAAAAGQAEKAELLQRKQGDEPGAKTIGDWESTYYIERIKAERFHFDARAVRPYFEYRAVRQAILDLSSELFGLSFMPVTNWEAWHPDVETFDVTVDGESMGRISLDMHPREGKYKHAACFPLRLGVGGKQTPHIVLVCNLPDPKAQAGPALMAHSEVVTFFHEFGHLVHGIISGRVPWVRLAFVREWDFVEAPSQFLEEWIYDFDVLRRFARHVETGETIPAELVERLRAARDFGRALTVRRQAFLSALSLTLHELNAQGLDTTEVVFDLARQYSPVEISPGTHLEASFGHLEGYTAAYYTYMWSLVIAKDLHSAFREGLMDTRQARRYRDLILKPGGSKPAAQLVEDFLGRPYSFDAFQNWLAPRTPSPVGVSSSD
jgi:thimet oligopeptidase